LIVVNLARLKLGYAEFILAGGVSLIVDSISPTAKNFSDFESAT
jgi:hypothetical protein